MPLEMPIDDVVGWAWIYEKNKLLNYMYNVVDCCMLSLKDGYWIVIILMKYMYDKFSNWVVEW